MVTNEMGTILMSEIHDELLLLVLLTAVWIWVTI